MPNEQILPWEGVTMPSYWGGNILADSGQAAMDQLAATGASTVTIIPNFFQHDKYSNEVALKLDPTNPWGSESDSYERVAASIASAKERGMNVVLKPHVETDDRVWRAELAPTDPKAWFASYKSVMVEYAKVAQSAGASMFCIGTEMDSMIDPTKSFVDENGATKTYTQAWIDIIDAVRAVYSGKLTYASTYWTVMNVGFWSKLDFIGVDAYIPMSTVNDPTVDQMVDAWTKPHFNPWLKDLYQGMSVVDFYKSLSEQYGKQVIFTEVGYQSKDGANKDPGNFSTVGTYDPQEQVDCYNALFKVMENYGGQWLGGAFLWSYHAFADPMTEKNVPWTDYTPQLKPANAVITENYSSPEHGTGLVWTGTAAADKLDGGYNNDTLNGGDGNDTLWGGGGNDTIDGGTGSDTAVFSGDRSSYTIVHNNDGSITVRGQDGTDLLTNVAFAKFADQTVDLANEPTNQTPAIGGVDQATTIAVADTVAIPPKPFANVTITDDSASVTAVVTMDDQTKGAFTNVGTGTYDAEHGTYTVTGTAAQVQAAIQALQFDPADRPDAADGSTETTTFTITVTDDGNLSATADANVTVDATHGTVTAAATVEFAAATLAVSHNEGDGGQTTSYTYTLTRTGDTTSTADLHWAAAGAGAHPADAADFGGTLPGGSVHFAADETTATITVSVSDDATVEQDEQFTVTLSDATGATLGSHASATGTISNDDTTGNAQPEIGGVDTPVVKTVLDTETATPFADVTLSDDSAYVIASVTLDDDAKGAFTVDSLAAGFYYDEATHAYTMMGTRGVVEAALKGLVFDPTDRPTDAVDAAETTSFTLTVKDIEGAEASTSAIQVEAHAANRGPVGPVLYGNFARELAATGTVVGTLAAADPNAGDSLTYTLTNNAGGRFAVVGNQLVVANGFLLDYEQARVHYITVQVQDAHGGVQVQNFAVGVSDLKVEKTAGSAGNDVFKGGRYNDVLKGGNGNDQLWGGLGRDALYGGRGKDVFVFNTKTSKKVMDKIADFNVKDDTIWLDNKYFKKLGRGTEKHPGKLNAKFFTIGDHAKDKNDYLIYDNKKGVLYYDADGSGHGKAVEITQIKKGLKMTYHDFMII